MSVYRFPRRALTHCPLLCMGIQPDTRLPARSADALLCPQLCMGITPRQYTKIGLSGTCEQQLPGPTPWLLLW